MIQYIIAIAILTAPIACLSAKKTQLQLYRPFTENINHPALHPLRNLEGLCDSRSKKAVRIDAWRCIANGMVFDPCFQNPYNPHQDLLCPISPWSEKGIKLQAKTITNRHPQPLDMSRNYPWAIELVTGAYCMRDEGHALYDGLIIHYRCDDGSYLFGQVQRCRERWTMLWRKDSTTRTVKINKAWF